MPTTSVAPTTAINTPGRRLLRLSSRITASVPAPSVNADQFVLPASTPLMSCRISCSGPSASTEKPNSAGNWLTSTVSAMPFM